MFTLLVAFHSLGRVSGKPELRLAKSRNSSNSACSDWNFLCFWVSSFSVTPGNYATNSVKIKRSSLCVVLCLSFLASACWRWKFDLLVPTAFSLAASLLYEP